MEAYQNVGGKGGDVFQIVKRGFQEFQFRGEVRGQLVGISIWGGSDILWIGRDGEQMNILFPSRGLVILSTIDLWHFYDMCFCASILYNDDICNINAFLCIK